MSSTINNIKCPICNGFALQETNHKTGEIYNHCVNCTYEEVIVEEFIKFCKYCGEEFEKETGSKNNPEFCCDDCNFAYYSEQLDFVVRIKMLVNKVIAYENNKTNKC